MNKFLLVCALLITLHANSQNSCPANIGFETGDFSNWNIYAGSVALTGGQNVVTVAPSAALPLRHVIMSTPNVYDVNVPTLPVTAPGSNYSARLGYSNTTGADAERISYTLTVPTGPNTFSITYQYALVQQNPGHTPVESQPHFSAKIYDSTTSQYIGCVTNKIFYGSPTGNLQTVPGNPNVMYVPWTSVTVVLDDYKGHKLSIEFTNADCTFGGHWAYSYVDVAAYCGVPALGNNFCAGTTPTIVGPFGYQYYNWWNSNFTQNLGNTQTLTLTTAPSSPTVYAVEMIPYANYGCKDTVFVTAQQMPGVIVNAGPDITTCSNSGPVMIGSPGITGYSYTWFPSSGLTDGTVAQPLVQPSSTTSYVVVAVDASTGCSSKDTVIVTVVNVNTPTITQVGNILVSSFLICNQWSFNGVNIVGATGPTYTPIANGVYRVQVSCGGCTSPYSAPFTYSITGLDPIAAEWKLKIAPNPLSDQLVISYSGNQKLDVEILDIAGRKMFSQKSIPGVYSIDVSKFLSGNYLVRVFDSKTNKEVKKMVTKL